MKKLITLAFTLLTITAFGQKSPKVELNWKINPGDTISYKTIMARIDSSVIKYNFGKIFNLGSDSTDIEADEAAKLYKELSSIDNVDTITNLSCKKDSIVDIEMVAKAVKDIKELIPDSLKKYLEYMPNETPNQSILLRGSVYKTGGIHSFWLTKGQKNALAVFFELPQKPVKAGDSWKIDINFISTNQYFECDTSYKSNKVTLASLRETQDNDTIATIKYEITEYIKGNYYVPSLFSSTTDTVKMEMKVSYQAKAEFSVTKGRWISYEGILHQYSKGLVDADIFMRYALIKQ